MRILYELEAVERLARFVEIVRDETERQNLISPSTIPLTGAAFVEILAVVTASVTMICTPSTLRARC